MNSVTQGHRDHGNLPKALQWTCKMVSLLDLFEDHIFLEYFPMSRRVIWRMGREADREGKRGNSLYV